MTTQTPDAVREARPYVAGPIWAEPEDDCFTAEIQTVGGHSVIATVHGSTRDEAEQRQRAILTALDSRAGDAVPAGWRLVPIEPTRAMLNAAAVADDGTQAHYLDAYRAIWSAMLAALSHGEGRK